MELKSADNALYEAKESGRNQVVISEESGAKQREATFFNKSMFKDIRNKTYINCDANTAYDISQTAQQMKVEHSVKYEGYKSSVVVDGVKNKEFVGYVAGSSEEPFSNGAAKADPLISEIPSIIAVSREIIRLFLLISLRFFQYFSGDSYLISV